MPGDPTQTATYLRWLNTSDRVRAAAFDAVHNATDNADAEARMRALQLPDDVRATLWDLRSTGNQAMPLPQAATAGMMAPSTMDGDPKPPDTRFAGIADPRARELAQWASGSPAEERWQETKEHPIRTGVTIGLMGLPIESAVAGIATRGARAVYRGFLKPSISARMAPRADQIVQTALDEALPITRGGAATGQRVINELRTEVDSILAQSKGRVDLRAIADKVRAFAKRKYFKPGADQTDYKAALDVADRLDQHPSLGLPPGVRPTRVKVSAATANEAKRALDASVGDAGFGVKTGATRTAEKFARRETRQALEGIEPAIRPLNARESKLIDATRAISQAVEREANRNAMFGVPSIMAGAMGGAEYARGGDPSSAAALALAARAGMHPTVASRAAIVAHRMAKELGVAASTAARLAVAVVSEDAGQEER